MRKVSTIPAILGLSAILTISAILGFILTPDTMTSDVRSVDCFQIVRAADGYEVYKSGELLL